MIAPKGLRRRRAQSIVQRSAIESLERRLLMANDLLQYHNDARSTGQNLTETVLTPANVNATNFGKLFNITLDGQVYAQPLVKTNVNITRGASQGIHNVVYVATQHDSLYAIDANAGDILWQDSFFQIADPRVGVGTVTAGVTTFPATSGNNSLVNGNDIGPELGILATPTIDASTGILYLVTNSQEYRNGSTPTATFTLGTTDIHYVQRLWAINIANGAVAINPSNIAVEPASGGQIIGDTIINPTSGSIPSYSSFTGYKYVAGPFIKGSGDNGINNAAPRDGWVAYSGSAQTHPWTNAQTPMEAGYIVFNALLQMGRCAVTKVGNNIFLGYASHGDKGPYYGYLLGFNATTLANNACFVTAPTFEPFADVSGNNGQSDAQAGLWMSGDSITTDGTYLYFTTGNGAFDVAASNFSASYFTTDTGNTVLLPLDDDYGNTVMKLAIDPAAQQNGTPDGTYNPTNYNPNGFGLKVVDFFCPSNAIYMNLKDEDLGSGGILLLPETITSTVPGHVGHHMLITGGKEGRIYLMDRENLGGYNTSYPSTRDANGVPTISADPSTYDRVLGEYSVNGVDVQTNQFYSTASFYQNGANPLFFVGLGKKPNWEFNLTAFQAAQSPPNSASINTPIASTATNYGSRGTTSSITANGSSNAILWNLNVGQTATDNLLAYSTSLGTAIYDSNTNAARDSLTAGVVGATGTKFSVVSVSNGLVYAGTGGNAGSTNGVRLGTFVGYGLLNSYLTSAPSLFGAPTNLSVSAAAATTAHLSWIRHSTAESEMRVDRSTDGVNWTTLQYLPNGSTSYDDATISASTQYFYRVSAVSGANVTAFTESAYFTSNSGVHQYYVRRDVGGTNLQITLDNAPSPQFTLPISALTSLTLNTGGGLEQMTVDYQNGNPVPSGGISFVGSPALGAADTLNINGTTGADNVALAAGAVSLGGSSNVVFSQVENLVIATGAGNDTVTQTANPGVATATFNGGSNTDTLNVNGGTWTFKSDPQLNTTSLTVNDNAAVVFTAPVNGQGMFIRNLTALNLSSGATVTLNTNATSHSDRILLITSALAFGGTTNNWQGKVDLGGNDLIVKNGNLADLTNQIKQGFNLAGPGFWNGANGILSSTAAADATHLTALGVILNNNGSNQPLYGSGTPFGTFDNQSPAFSDSLVKYTYFGDTELNGKIDGADYSKTDNGFNMQLTGAWADGDFNYDGPVDGADYALIDNAFIGQAAHGGGLITTAAVAKPGSVVSTAATPATQSSVVGNIPATRSSSFSGHVSTESSAGDVAALRWFFGSGDDDSINT